MAMVHKIIHRGEADLTTPPGLRERRTDPESNKMHSRSLQLESEAWQAGPEEEFLQYPSYKGLEP
jgi:hypothetical protein